MAGTWLKLAEQEQLIETVKPVRLTPEITPILFGLALYRWRFWIFDLHPMR